MKEELLSLVKGLKSNRRLDSLDEAATKQVVILRVLSLLGWDTYNIDEVEPEHLVAGTKVDNLLRHANKAQAFIEVKRAGEVLERHQEQLLNYSFKEGVNLAVLTNGVTWWFYLPLLPGNWEQRKFFSIDIYDQLPEEVVSRLIDYLAKDNVASGRAEENARAVYGTRQKEYEISKTLPKAWSKIITEPSPVFIELIADSTEKICGYRPDSSVVKNFISSSLPLSADEPSRPIHKTAVTAEGRAKTTVEPKKTLEHVMRHAEPPLRNLFSQLSKEILSLGENVRQVVGLWYIDYRKSSTFVSVIPQTKKNRLLINIKMGDRKVDDVQKWISPIPDSYGYGKLNTQFEIGEPSQVNYAMHLIRQAYDFVP
jgi:predicted type IV restriction endonuclease/predicted transport protein